MTTRPILFSGPMVRALLEGRKTQTRRILKDQPGDIDKPFMMDDGSWHVTDSRGGHMSPLAVRFRKGDRLWVREAWRCNGWATDVATIMYRASEGGGYTAMTEQFPVADRKPLRVTPGWRPCIHLPRWASRITLDVTDVRVERLQSIVPADAIAEGVFAPATSQTIDCETRDPRDDFAGIWRTINGAVSWNANPWVAAVTFTVDQRNVDCASEGQSTSSPSPKGEHITSPSPNERE